MKIDSGYKPNLAPLGNRAPAPAAAEPKASGDSVNLSSVASTLQGQATPPLNNARIQEIKDAIAQGRFKINPETIADGLIESARDLINHQRKA